MPHVNRTMSAPLRPSSRVIPRTVEAQFANKDVFTLVIPSPRVTGYSDDWVMWFAERQTETDPSARILAPIPARKAPPAASTAVSQSSLDATIQFAAVIDKTGRIGSAKIIRGTKDPSVIVRALDELATWEFQPALRNGEPVEVEIVIEIPFQFRATAQATR